MAIEKKTTFCRVCEPACGLVASVENGELVALAPDRAHPITQGFACNKGIAGLDIHRDPDRLARPLKRAPDGSFAAISWEDAPREIAQRLHRSVRTIDHHVEAIFAKLEVDSRGKAIEAARRVGLAGTK